MIKNKEAILQEKTEKLYEYVKIYLDDMDTLSDTSDFTIDNIEKMWGGLEDTTKQVLREINEDMISQINEKAIIKAKKKEYAEKGIVLINKQKTSITILTTIGPLSIRRTILQPSSAEDMVKLKEKENSSHVIPMDIALGIDVLPFKMTREMMCEVSFWAQNQTSFKAAEEIIYKVHGVLIGACTIRIIADYVGKIIYEQDTKEANEIYEKLNTIEYTKRKKGILYIQMDGAALNTRIKDKDGSSWRENKLGMVFSSDNIRTSN